MLSISLFIAGLMNSRNVISACIRGSHRELAQQQGLCAHFREKELLSATPYDDVRNITHIILPQEKKLTLLDTSRQVTMLPCLRTMPIHRGVCIDPSRGPSKNFKNCRQKLYHIYHMLYLETRAAKVQHVPVAHFGQRCHLGCQAYLRFSARTSKN